MPMPTEQTKLNELDLLYVHWAMHHLFVVKNALDNLYEFSNIDTHTLAEPLHKAMTKLIRENRAYERAAALLFAGVEPAPYNNPEVGTARILGQPEPEAER